MEMLCETFLAVGDMPLYTKYALVIRLRACYLACVVFQKLQGALLSCMYAALDYSQTGLIAAVFVFKVNVFL